MMLRQHLLSMCVPAAFTDTGVFMAVKVEAVFRRVNGQMFTEVNVSTASVDFCSDEMRQATAAAQLLTERFAAVTGVHSVNFINGEGHYVN
ncbi:hypothetical protein MNQ21_000529 [Salmonella enterica]|nr:hypothetical protein [Salmonella enterica]